MKYLFRACLLLIFLSSGLPVLALQDPCKLVSERQISDLIKDFGYKKARYVDGRSYFMGQSCQYFGDGKTVFIGIEEKADFESGENIFSSAKEKFEKEKQAASPGVITVIDGIGDAAIWNHVSLKFLKDGNLYTIRVRAGKGISGSGKVEVENKVERMNLNYSKALAKIILEQKEKEQSK